jgi:hypothetical protein
VTTEPAGFPSRADLVDAGAALVTAGLLVVVGLGVTGAGRVALALVFVTFVPGWTVLDYLPLVPDASRTALAVALSLSLSTLATVTVLWLHLWWPRDVLDVAGTLCLFGLLWHLAHPANRPRPAAPSHASVSTPHR